MSGTYIIETSEGNITIELSPKEAPKTCENFIAYVNDKHFDGLTFHRVIPGFMIQGGGLDAGMQQKATPRRVVNESFNGLLNKRGTLSMARTSDPDSATSQFFINVADNAFLDGNKAANKHGYAVFAKVTAGMDVVDKIVSAKTGRKGMHDDVPLQAITIKTIRAAS